MTMADEASERAESARKQQEERTERARTGAKDAAERKQKIVDDATKRMSAGKPTPTQEENDRAALGEHILEHEKDGSEEEKSPGEQAAEQERKHAEARPAPERYRTRQTTPT
jgi:hypothetical protein